MVRYTLLRFLIFFGTLSLLWLLGLRSEAERPWLVIGAATLSMVISFFALRPLRQDTVERLSGRVESRIAGRRSDSDEAIEDAVSGQDAGASPAEPEFR
ncbi:DUF4229 domain-containing protein [Nostocoides sp.]|jgi:hypothetical protein|uniref:DUF4229 domain-containing protein n=1 Tax=Nostocoides sp. TaxID=1917966 RepID=UPI002BD43276|nr:DUF4229 domain-containing protein [Tetrasphaera sp.]